MGTVMPQVGLWNVVDENMFEVRMWWLGDQGVVCVQWQKCKKLNFLEFSKNVLKYCLAAMMCLHDCVAALLNGENNNVHTKTFAKST